MEATLRLVPTTVAANKISIGSIVAVGAILDSQAIATQTTTNSRLQMMVMGTIALAVVMTSKNTLDKQPCLGIN